MNPPVEIVFGAEAPSLAGEDEFLRRGDAYRPPVERHERGERGERHETHVSQVFPAGGRRHHCAFQPYRLSIRGALFVFDLFAADRFPGF